MPLVPSFFFRPPRRRLADLIRVLTDIREYAITAATNSAHMLRKLDELKEIIVTDPSRDPNQPDPDRDDVDPAQPDGPAQPDEPDTSKGRRR